MNTADLVDTLAAADEKLTKTQAKALVDALLGALKDAAVRGEEVSLPGFGKFKVQAKPARTGRNPTTGAAIQIAASKKVVFQPAKALKDAVNG
ncbi:HU family DNA-binding protein [Phenylobacterium montanum]|uniref:HU family DNA-binding protein n=1 Tax=Phenylobacterium montanum TaxID=2823693 RepID=A0A975G042_9CAUL|nr:HU family DNA-binding protein [Caulobacter sp. S6]QUD88017.1 HU family DNA-binding protein [Caulobacter sp. S6]